MNYDITFCSNRKCKNLQCERNQNNIIKTMYGNIHIRQGDFKDCEEFEEEKDYGKENFISKNQKG